MITAHDKANAASAIETKASLAWDFVAQAKRHEAAGNLSMMAAALRMAAEFATEAAELL